VFILGTRRVEFARERVRSRESVKSQSRDDDRIAR
jgi:hypothetical protein